MEDKIEQRKADLVKRRNLIAKFVVTLQDQKDDYDRAYIDFLLHQIIRLHIKEINNENEILDI